MGLSLTIFEFRGDIRPNLSQIVDKAVEIGGLPIISSPQSPMPVQESECIRATLAFECLPKDCIEVEIRRVIRAKAKSIDVALESTPQAVETAESEGWNVKVTGYMGQEPTLMHAVALALESLGGTYKWKHIAENSKAKKQSEIRLPITAKALRRNYRKIQCKAILTMALLAILLPLLIPWGIVVCIIEYIKARRQGTELMRRYSDHFEAYNQKG